LTVVEVIDLIVLSCGMYWSCWFSSRIGVPATAYK